MALQSPLTSDGVVGQNTMSKLDSLLPLPHSALTKFDISASREHHAFQELDAHIAG